MAKPSREEMLMRERIRLKSLSRLELFDELYGESSRELADTLLEHYEEDLELGEIVPCSSCGRDCIPEEKSEDTEAEWFCGDCGDEEED